MGFLAPIAFIFAVSLPLLLIFYLLKVKRQPRRVSSTFLWREVVEDARASVPFQKLRRNLLMFLQLLILALLVMALTRPVLNLMTRQRSSSLILIDISASMAARESRGGATRLEEAQDKARRFIDSLPEDSQALVISYADRAAVEVPVTTDRSKLRAGIDALEVRATGADTDGALRLAASLLGSLRNPRIVIFSDSAEFSEARIEEISGTPLVVESCGVATTNFGWTALDLRRRSTTSPVYDLFGQVGAYGGEAREVTLEVRAGDRILDVRRVALTPGEETAVVVENLELTEATVVMCELKGADGEFDALATDNAVWIRAEPNHRLRVLYCTPGNYFLSRVLMAAGEMDVIEISPGDPLPEGEFDAAVYDRSFPAQRPGAPGIFIAISPWGKTGEDDSDDSGQTGDPDETDDAEPDEISVGPITGWDTEHPLTRLVQWSTISIYGAMPIEPPEGTSVLVQADADPLVLLGRSEEQMALAITFDLFRSNFPLRSAFPIFFKNAIDWLTSERAGRDVQWLAGGETYSMSVPENVGAVSVVSPSGERHALRAGRDRLVAFSETYEPGLWRVEFDEEPVEEFGVNLMDIKESTLAIIPSRSIDAAGESIDRGLAEELRTNREIWRWLAVAALAFLMAEWFLYHRGMGV